MTSNPARRMLSTVVEPMTRATSCNRSAAGNASRIWRAASSGEGECNRGIPGGLSVASLVFNRRFSTLLPPMRCMSSELVPDTFSPSSLPLHRMMHALYTLCAEYCSVVFAFAPLRPNFVSYGARPHSTVSNIPRPTCLLHLLPQCHLRSVHTNTNNRRSLDPTCTGCHSKTI